MNTRNPLVLVGGIQTYIFGLAAAAGLDFAKWGLGIAIIMFVVGLIQTRRTNSATIVGLSFTIPATVLMIAGIPEARFGLIFGIIMLYTGWATLK